MAKIKCRFCGRSTGRIKHYIIADDLEHPKPYHKKCLDAMYLEALFQFMDSDISFVDVTEKIKD